MIILEMLKKMCEKIKGFFGFGFNEVELSDVKYEYSTPTDVEVLNRRISDLQSELALRDIKIKELMKDVIIKDSIIKKQTVKISNLEDDISNVSQNENLKELNDLRIAVHKQKEKVTMLSNQVRSMAEKRKKVVSEQNTALVKRNRLIASLRKEIQKLKGF